MAQHDLNSVKRISVCQYVSSWHCFKEKKNTNALELRTFSLVLQWCRIQMDRKIWRINIIFSVYHKLLLIFTSFLTSFKLFNIIQKFSLTFNRFQHYKVIENN